MTERVCCDPEGCGYRNEEPFECPACDRSCCPCNGCADDAPALCDDCWCRFFVDVEDDVRELRQ